ncbi:hypothetical protein V2G26_008982 [Clonostachys chloroleuca]
MAGSTTDDRSDHLSVEKANKTTPPDTIQENEPSNDEDVVYPTGITLILIITSLCLAVFLVALDQTIIAPALGAITAEYKSVKDIVGMVWFCIPAHDDCFAAHVRKYL